MKSFIFAAVAIAFFTGHPANAIPHKVDTITCEGAGQKIVMTWDSSKSIFVSSILVNGNEELPGSEMEINAENETKFSKGKLYAIKLPSESPGNKFDLKASVNEKEISMSCEHVSDWKLF